MAFNGMAEADLTALVAFLRTVPPVKRQNEPKRIMVPLFESVFLPAWLAAFAVRETPPPVAPTSGLARGEYLVKAVAHCGECHTPRGATGALNEEMHYAGSKEGPEGELAPNITPDEKTGIGSWSVADISWFLQTGFEPGGDDAQGLMRQVIDHGYQYLEASDLQAIAIYLKSLKPISNEIESTEP
jgi:mono/diheme cytochrome c family protein